MKTLLIVSHTPHYRNGDAIVGWGPTIREVDHLASLFQKVIHLAVLYNEAAPNSSLPYQSQNIEFIPVPPSGGTSFFNKINVLFMYIRYLKVLNALVNKLGPEDLVHVRAPANISLLAMLYLSVRKLPLRRWVKYAGNWAPTGWEPWSYKFQRWLLKKDIPGCVVTINGEWPEQPERIISFNNPSFSKRELTDARALCSGKELGLPLKLLFVGRLENEKGAQRTLDITKALLDKGINVDLIMIGDGRLRSSYELFSQENGLNPAVRFLGWQPKTELLQYYLRSHFILLPTSASEGWPKVLSEAMACGTVPLAGDVSAIPQVLKKIGAGQAFPPNDLGSFVNAIQAYIENPQQWRKESQACISAAEGFTYEAYLEQVKSMFKTSWGVDISI